MREMKAWRVGKGGRGNENFMQGDSLVQLNTLWWKNEDSPLRRRRMLQITYKMFENIGSKSLCFGPKRIVGKCESNQFVSLYGGAEMQRLGDYNHMQKPDILKQFFIVFQRIGLKINNRIS